MARSHIDLPGQIDLPLIDLSNPDKPTNGKILLDAAVNVGFFYVNGSFTGSKIDQMFAISEEFFGLPLTEKSPFRRSSSNNGWVGMHVETLDPEHHDRGDFKEALNIGELQNDALQQPLPACTMAHEAAIAHFTRLCNQTCGQILELIAHGLEIPADFFTSRHEPSRGSTGNSLRLLYYPADVPSYDPGKDIRAGAHSDYGSITLLFQRPGQPGLEIKSSAGWAPVPIYPRSSERYSFPPILVNIGDILSYWTDGLLKSTIHRVVFPSQATDQKREDRYSIAFFSQPVGSEPLIPVPSKVVQAHSEQCKERDGSATMRGEKDYITAEQHLQSRFAATYISRK